MKERESDSPFRSEMIMKRERERVIHLSDKMKREMERSMINEERETERG